MFNRQPLVYPRPAASASAEIPCVWQCVAHDLHHHFVRLRFSRRMPLFNGRSQSSMYVRLMCLLLLSLILSSSSHRPPEVTAVTAAFWSDRRGRTSRNQEAAAPDGLRRLQRERRGRVPASRPGFDARCSGGGRSDGQAARAAACNFRRGQHDRGLTAGPI